MQQMLKSKKDDDDAAVGPSAFHPAGNFGKSPPISANVGSHRDSGYGTDFSPASVTSASRRFTYDDCDLELAEEFGDMDLSRDNDVFCEAGSSQTIFECNETDDTDREVEGLLTEDSSPYRSVSQPIQIQRPSAPIPTPEEDKLDETSDNETDQTVESVSGQWYHVDWNIQRERHLRRNRFRPIVSRSVGTQTPSPQCQIIRDAMTSVETLGRFMPYARDHGDLGPVLSNFVSYDSRNVAKRLRLRSDSEDIDCKPPLPDIVPMSRDRSISLPDVPSFRRREQEQEVGRELRRISDEFNSSFTSVRRERTTYRHASSFPLVVNIDFHAYLTSLRRILSSSPIFQLGSGGSSGDTNFQDRHGDHR